MMKINSNSYRKKGSPSSSLARYAKIFFISFFVIFISWVIYQNTEKLWLPPEVTLYNAQNNQMLTRNLFTLKGKVTQGDSLFINGNNIPLDEEKEFEYDIVFGYGITRVPLSVYDKFNKQNTRYIYFYRPRSE